MVVDHLGTEYRSMSEMLKAYNVSKQTFSARQKRGLSLEDCLLGVQRKGARDSRLVRVEKYADVDAQIEFFDFKGKTYSSIKDYPVFKDVVSRGVFLWCFAKAFGYIIDVSDMLLKNKISVSKIRKKIPSKILGFVSGAALERAVDRFYYRNADVFASTFVAARVDLPLSNKYRYQVGDYWFKDRRSLLTFLQMCGVPVLIDVDKVYSMDTEPCAVYIKSKGIGVLLADLEDSDVLSARSSIFGTSDDDSDECIEDEYDNEDVDFYQYDAVIKDNTSTVVEEPNIEESTESETEDDTPFTFVDSSEDEDSADYLLGWDFESMELVEETSTSEDVKYFFIDYGNVVYSSMSDFEEAYNCDWKTVYNKIKDGYTLEEAMLGGYFADVNDDGGFDFRNGVDIDGVHFDSLKSFCNLVGVPCNVVLTRLRRGFCTSVMEAIKKPSADRDLQSMLFKMFVEKCML